jgi:UDP-N-acetylglucosamine 3-dehydrogenase
MMTRIGLIGRGKWGRNIERTLLSFEGVSVILIGRDDPLRQDVDGVVIATPSATHAEQALPYIQAGIATFIEKPMATSVADAKSIQDAARRSQAAVFVGHIHLYNPAFHALLRELAVLGTIRYISCESANSDPRSDSSVLWDWLPHDLSIARTIFRSDPTSVQAWSLTGGQRIEAAVCRFQYGAASLVSVLSWLSPLRRRQVTVYGEGGVIIFDDRASQKLSLHRKYDDSFHPSYDSEPALTNELRVFLRCVHCRSSDASDVALGVAIAHAIESAEESARNGGVAIEIRS